MEVECVSVTAAVQPQVGYREVFIKGLLDSIAECKGFCFSCHFM